MHVQHTSAGHRAGHTYIPYGFIERPECWLLVVVVDASVTVQDRHTFTLSVFAVASVHAVVRPVVPVAGEHIETLWGDKRRTCSKSVPAPVCVTGDEMTRELNSTQECNTQEPDWDPWTKSHCQGLDGACSPRVQRLGA